MNNRVKLAIAMTLIAFVGCGKQAEPPAKNSSSGLDPKIEAERAKLAPADRKLADAQNLCPIHDQPLGHMGKPYKLDLEGETVFLCCEACASEAKADAKKTIAKVKELRNQSESR